MRKAISSVPHPLEYKEGVASFEQLYQQYVDKVYQTCLSFTKDQASAQDYTQDIFLKVFENLPSFQQRSLFSTWLYAISRNHCVSRLRTDGRLKTESLSDQSLLYPVIDNESMAETESQYQYQLLALQRLPDKELNLLRLKYEQGLSIQQIGQRYQLSESAVKMRLKRSRERLQTYYQELISQ